MTKYRTKHLREALGDRYEFEGVLGRGAFAAVYLVRNRKLDRREALKVLSETYDGDPAFVRRFINEAKLVASLDHPSIVKVYDFGEVDGLVWFSMQYIDGPTLRAELQARRRLVHTVVAGLAAPLLDALGYSHRQGTIHRDIKPSNILLDGRGRPYLMDFGIAKSAGSASQTMTGNILGTPAYISPEQVQGLAIDGRADLYSLGAAMYEMLAGRPPFQGQDSLQTIVKRIHEDPEPLHLQCFSLSPQLEAIVMEALRREPEERFSDAAAMRQSLLDYLSQEGPLEAWTPTAPPPQLGELDKNLVSGKTQDAANEGGETGETRVLIPTKLGPPGRRTLGGWLAAVAGIGLALLSIALLIRLRPEGVSSQPDAQLSKPRVARAGEAAELPTKEPGFGASETPDKPDSEPDVPIVGQLPGGAKPEGQVVKEETARVAETETRGSSPEAEASSEQVPREPMAESSKKATTPLLPEPEPVPVRRPMFAPKLLDSTPGTLPTEQASLCAGEEVIASLRVGEDGRVERVRVLKASRKDCVDAAKIVAQGYVFEPAKAADGLPVTASTTINIRFKQESE